MPRTRDIDAETIAEARRLLCHVPVLTKTEATRRLQGISGLPAKTCQAALVIAAEAMEQEDHQAEAVQEAQADGLLFPLPDIIPATVDESTRPEYTPDNLPGHDQILDMIKAEALNTLVHGEWAKDRNAASKTLMELLKDEKPEEEFLSDTEASLLLAETLTDILGCSEDLFFIQGQAVPQLPAKDAS